MSFKIPTKGNEKLTQLVQHIEQDQELQQIWKCANITAVDRCGISDHGEIHIRIVANAALRILRLLIKGGVEPSCVKDHQLTNDDAEIIVVLAACLHDTGISIHRDHHERYSLFIAYTKARQLLTGIYDEPNITTMVAETLHAIIAHDADERCLTIEGGALRVADGTDMTEGRSRIPFQAGQINIHSVSAMAVDSVSIEKGEERPVRIKVSLANSAGIFQLDNLLREKIKNSTLASYVEVEAYIHGETEKRLFEVFKM